MEWGRGREYWFMGGRIMGGDKKGFDKMFSYLNKKELEDRWCAFEVWSLRDIGVTSCTVIVS